MREGSSLNSIEKITQVGVGWISRDTSIYNEHSTHIHIPPFSLGKSKDSAEIRVVITTQYRRREKTELIEMEIWYFVDIFPPFILIYVCSRRNSWPILRSFLLLMCSACCLAVCFCHAINANSRNHNESQQSSMSFSAVWNQKWASSNRYQLVNMSNIVIEFHS